MKKLKKIALFVLLFVSGTVSMSAYSSKPSIEGCSTCNDELQAVIAEIKNKAKQKNGILVEETYFADENPNSSEKRKIVWQGGYTYCGGTCFAVVTITANCFLGYCWGYTPTATGDEGCSCGPLLPD